MEDGNLKTKMCQWNSGPIKPKGTTYFNPNSPQFPSLGNIPTIPISFIPARTTRPNLFPESTIPYKRLTDTEIQTKGENGLCYHCLDKFAYGHRCRNKELQVLVIREWEEESDSEVMIDECKLEALGSNDDTLGFFN